MHREASKGLPRSKIVLNKECIGLEDVKTYYYHAKGGTLNSITSHPPRSGECAS